MVFDPSLGLAPELAAVLGLSTIELAALLPTDPERNQRTVLSVLHRGSPIAIAKVAPQGSEELDREARVLAALETSTTRVLEPPRLLGSFGWCGLDVIVMTSCRIHGRTDRALGDTEEEALIELASVAHSLTSVLVGEGTAPVHGDFCGWNSSAQDGRLAVWDWEWAHLGEPLEDWFHWQTQRLVHFGHGTPGKLVEQALAPSPKLRSLFDRLAVDPYVAPASLAASLRGGLVRVGASGHGREVTLREQTLSILEQRTQ